jgi:hypothetical protein
MSCWRKRLNKKCSNLAAWLVLLWLKAHDDKWFSQPVFFFYISQQSTVFFSIQNLVWGSDKSW